MRTVRDLLGGKGQSVWSVRPSDTVYEALALMAEKNVGAVMVLDEAGALVGVLSERDYARKVVLHGHSSRQMLVSEIMTPRVLGIGPDATIEEALSLMTSARVRHLPVVEAGTPIGVVSIGDVGQAIISNQGFLIQQLERYICAG